MNVENNNSSCNRIVKIWLDHGCDKSPEEIAQIISSEYQGRK